MDRLEEILKEIGNETETAKKAGINLKTINRWKNNDFPPQIKTIGKLAKAHNINLNWLILGEGKKYRVNEGLEAIEKLKEAIPEFKEWMKRKEEE